MRRTSKNSPENVGSSKHCFNFEESNVYTIFVPGGVDVANFSGRCLGPLVLVVYVKSITWEELLVYCFQRLTYIIKTRDKKTVLRVMFL
jgi:hypothetical protein